MKSTPAGAIAHLLVAVAAFGVSADPGESAAGTGDQCCRFRGEVHPAGSEAPAAMALPRELRTEYQYGGWLRGEGASGDPITSSNWAKMTGIESDVWLESQSASGPSGYSGLRTGATGSGSRPRAEGRSSAATWRSACCDSTPLPTSPSLGDCGSGRTTVAYGRREEYRRGRQHGERVPS